MPQIVSTLPAAVDVGVLSDRTVTIRASVSDVEFELALAIVLVVVVIFVFLRTLPGTIIPSLSVPLSLVGTLGVMYLLNFSLDNLSLMALTIATGFVVDDAIVMIENIARYVEDGMHPVEAALRGSAQIGFTIISLTISLIAVLIPLLFMGDVVGRLFHEFAITLAVTIVISAVVSLTLVPMMCAKLIRHHSEAERSSFDIHAERAFDALIALYARALNWVLDRQPLTLAVAILTLGVTVLLYIMIPKGFFPVQDTGMIQGISEASQSISYQAMATLQNQVAEAILKDPDVEGLSSFIGVDGTNQTQNTGRFLINLKPHDERKLTATQIMRRIQKEISGIVGITLYMQPVQDLTIDATISRAPYHFVLEDANPTEFNAWVPRLVDRLSQLPQITDVASDLQQQGLALDIVIDRATAARFGITPATVDNALYDAFGQRIISTIYTQSNQYRVIMEVDPALQTSLKGLSMIYLPSSSSTTNGQVPLSAIVHVEQRNGPLLVTHFGQLPATTISFNTAPGVSLGAAVDAIEQTEHDLGLPISFTTAFQGTAAAFQSSLLNEVFLIIAAVVAMYIVLGVLYESFVHPITILSTLPSAGVGALLSLMLLHYDLDIIAIIGIILLIGIVKKNAIMMIDFALEAERVEGLPPRPGDLSGLPAAIPADHDDDDGGDSRRAAVDGWNRHRLRAASTAGHRHHRRLDLQPVADAVHHTGDLSLLRSPGAASDREAARLIHWRRATSRPNEHFRPVHFPACSNHFADARHCHRWHSRIFQAAGIAAAASRFSDDFRNSDAAWCQPKHCGDQRRRAARAPSRTDRRRQRNDVAKRDRTGPHYAAVRHHPRYRRRRA